MSRGREALLLLLVLALGLGTLTAFGLLDRRDPNDHDGYYSNELIERIDRYHAAGTPAARARVLSDEALWYGSYPPAGRVVMVWAQGEFGWGRAVFRLVNLPFFALLVLGTWLLGRELGGRRVGVLAALLVIGVPTMVVHSRKFAPPWFAAALSPLSWALLLLALRLEGRRGWAAALAAGLVQGLRCYTHPIVYPDVALSTGLVGLAAAGGAWRDRTPARRRALLRVAVAGGLALLLAAHLLGWGPPGAEPEYSFSRYREARAHVLEGELRLGALRGAAGLGVRQWFSMHLLPVGFVLAALGLAAGLRRAAGGDAGRDRAAARMLWAAVLLQVPLALTTISRGTFTSDWMHLVPSACVLAAWGVLGREGSPLRARARGWAGAAAAHSAAVLLVPFALSFAGPSPYADPGWYTTGPGRAFAHNASGSLWNTHHVPIREPGAFRRLTGLLGVPPTATYDPRVLDLLLLEPDTRTPCLIRPSDRSDWTWGAPRGQDLSTRWWSPWPALLAGVPPITPLFTTDGSVPDPEWRRRPEPGDAVARLASEDRRPVLVRLWGALDEPTRTAWARCRPTSSAPATSAAARDLLARVLPDHRVTKELMDLGGEFVGLEDGRKRDPRYASLAIFLEPR